MAAARPRRAGAFLGLWAATLGLLVFAAGPGRLQAAGPKTVALLPLRVNADKEMLYLRDGLAEMLNSRLFVPGGLMTLSRQAVMRLVPAAPVELTEAAARDLGRRLGVDYIAFGSATLPGQGVSLDLKMADVAGRRPMMSFFDHSGDTAGIIASVERLAVDMRNWALERPPAAGPAPPSAPAAGRSPDADASQRHPEEVFRQALAGGRSAEPAAVADPSRPAPERALSSEPPPQPAPAETAPAVMTAADTPAAQDEPRPPAALPDGRPVAAPLPPAQAGATLPSPADSAGPGAWTVLIASERTEEEARRTADALQGQNLAVRVERVDLPLKGVWYRVLTGEFASKTETQGAMERLRQAGFKPTAMPIQSGR